MDLPHLEARRLIQFSLDGPLDPTDRAALRAHVSQCMDCRVYENEIGDTEKLLRTVMRRVWNKRPAPLPMDIFRVYKKPKQIHLQVVAMRLSVVAATVVLFAFGIWQFSLTNNFIPVEYSSPKIPLIPTASTQLTSTRTNSNSCGNATYQVQPDDTLARIALRYSVSEEAIKLANDMRSGQVFAGMEIAIPQCTSTPTGTVFPSPTFTITVQSQTPGGGQ